MLYYIRMPPYATMAPPRLARIHFRGLVGPQTCAKYARILVEGRKVPFPFSSRSIVSSKMKNFPRKSDGHRFRVRQLVKIQLIVIFGNESYLTIDMVYHQKKEIL